MAGRRVFAVAVVAGIAAVLCGAMGFAGAWTGRFVLQPQPEPQPPKPTGPSPFWDDQGDMLWLYRNQYKTTMRMMWIDCAKVVTNGRGDAEPVWDLVEAYAKDISRRAERIGARWEQQVKTCNDFLSAVADADWLLASVEGAAFSKACDDCHLETWSPVYQHATKKIVEGWVDNKFPHAHDLELDEGAPPPATKMREKMQALLKYHDAAEAAATAKDAKAVTANLKLVLEVAEDQARRWNNLKVGADALATAAAEHERKELRGKYRDMASHCNQCHYEVADFVDPATPPRRIWMPIAWD
ncbi:MAG: hypothetical protein IT462_04475 [Planctomycetes bacterium]|nr:hypothetical protein [Planctomycetota bacterium]